MARPVFGFAGAGSMSATVVALGEGAFVVAGGSVVAGAVVGAAVVGGAVVACGLVGMTAGVVDACALGTGDVVRAGVAGGVVAGLVLGFTDGDIDTGGVVAAACFTTIWPVIEPWTEQTYENVPAVANVCVNVASFARTPESANVPVTEWLPSAQHHVTVPPRATSCDAGAYPVIRTVTSHAAAAGEAGSTTAPRSMRTASECFTPRPYGVPPRGDCSALARSLTFRCRSHAW